MTLCKEVVTLPTFRNQRQRIQTYDRVSKLLEAFLTIIFLVKNYDKVCSEWYALASHLDTVYIEVNDKNNIPRTFHSH